MKPIDIKCPTCHMEPGSPCVGVDFMARIFDWSHFSRDDMAYELGAFA